MFILLSNPDLRLIFFCMTYAARCRGEPSWPTVCLCVTMLTGCRDKLKPPLVNMGSQFHPFSYDIPHKVIKWGCSLPHSETEFIVLVVHSLTSIVTESVGDSPLSVLSEYSVASPFPWYARDVWLSNTAFSGMDLSGVRSVKATSRVIFWQTVCGFSVTEIVCSHGNMLTWRVPWLTQ